MVMFLKKVFWNDLSLKDKIINIGCLIFAILMFKISRLYFYVIFGYIIIMLLVKYSYYCNEIDKIKYEEKLKKKNEHIK